MVSRTLAAALLGSSGVAMGAFGAHALKVRAHNMMRCYDTACASSFLQIECGLLMASTGCMHACMSLSNGACACSRGCTLEHACALHIRCTRCATLAMFEGAACVRCCGRGCAAQPFMSCNVCSLKCAHARQHKLMDSATRACMSSKLRCMIVLNSPTRTRFIARLTAMHGRADNARKSRDVGGVENSSAVPAGARRRHSCSPRTRQRDDD